MESQNTTPVATAKKPVVVISDIRENSNNPNEVSVGFRKEVANPQGMHFDNLAFIRQGDPRINTRESKSLLVWLNMTKQSVEAIKLEVGLDINTLGHYNDAGEEFIYDLIEVYEEQLRPGRGINSQTGDVIVEPISSPSNNRIMLYTGRKLKFRFVDLVKATSVADLPKSQAKPTPLKDQWVEGFDGTKTIHDGFKNRKTADYTAFLNELYRTYNKEVLTEIPVADAWV